MLSHSVICYYKCLVALCYALRIRLIYNGILCFWGGIMGFRLVFYLFMKCESECECECCVSVVFSHNGSFLFVGCVLLWSF